ncbi:DUF368 domain-containing protein [Gracilibacillus sp. S3-1-1]|uniref:DUF368 domain-containing protein n=1 Tax=Gracilibacillus pellucidus TaxID=3095368 RepID=A0ACC6M623_9BACI|nr:DUF368 domain-containing protein [Gracilibacillus sp. S3-1-1]MDX8046323.1 DUF368 domain-containing protein [Gracilibacillus sp. S3-1-1]
MEWRNIYRGFLMGASDLVPGVSGGTLAVALGIYDRLIEAINGLFTKDFKKHLRFLIPLGIGIVAAVFLLSKLIKWLLHYYPQPTFFAFLGLVIGILPLLFRKADARKTFKVQHILLLVIGIALVAYIGINQTEDTSIVTEFEFSTYLWLLGSGFLASTAMILPGISGSFLLLTLGSYYTIINAVDELDFVSIGIVGIGVILGILIMSKILRYLLAAFPTAVYAFVIGMVIGSIFVIFPGWPISVGITIASILTFAIGLFVAYVLGRVEYR